MKRRKPGRGTDATGRSKGEGQYAPLPYAMLNSAAWRSLSGSAVKVYLELRTRFHGGNNGCLVLSLEEGARLLGIGKATVMRALEELQDKGFVIRTRVGFWYGRQASEWALTDMRTDGAPPTHAWKTWHPGMPSRSATKRTKKTEVGSGMKHIRASFGSGMDRSDANGFTSEPVRPISMAALGSGMDR